MADRSSSPDIPREPPLETDLYDILGISQDASPETIRSAYKKSALKNHPDKAPAEAKDEANHKFQQIAFAYAILSDERRRERFDRTGSTAEAVHDDDDFDWMEFYREQFSASVDVNALEQLKREYQGSEEEERDVLAAFEKVKGDMDGVYETVMLCNVLDDDERFRGIIDRAIADDRVENYKAYSGESDRKRQQRTKAAQKEAEEAQELAKEVEDKKKKGKKGGSTTAKKNKGSSDTPLDDNGLVAIIQQRQANRAGAFFDALEEKYAPKGNGNNNNNGNGNNNNNGNGNGKGKGKGKKRPAVAEPPEEAFAATAARKTSGQKKTRKTKA